MFLLAMQLPAAASAQIREGPWERPLPCVPCPTCEVRPPCVRGAQVVRTSSRAVLTLEGRVLRYEITEKFANRGTMVGERSTCCPAGPRRVRGPGAFHRWGDGDGRDPAVRPGPRHL